MQEIIAVEGLSKSYGSVQAVCDVNISSGTIASILYFPMMIFSGPTLPYEVMPTALQRFADILPLTYGFKLLKAASLGISFQEVWTPIVVMVVITVACTAVALKFFRWE